MNAVVVALGKIGLPLAVQVAGAGNTVTGCDIDEAVVATVNAGSEPFPGEAHLAERLSKAVGEGALTATIDTTAAVGAGPDLVIAVPPLMTREDGTTDWTALDAVVEAIGAGLQAGTTVSFETTVPVGTTRRRICPGLEAASGLTEGVDFHLVFSPERVFSGRVFADLATYPKLVGGLDAEGEARGVELYAQFLDAEVWGMGSAEAAEMAKLAETTYRDLNIGFANELARFAEQEGVNVDRVIEAANSQPFSHIHRPGIAVGGHCIPVYPRFYLEGDPDATLPAAAREVNEAVPAHAVSRLGDALGGLDGKTVLILGVAYRGGVKETAFSGAFPTADELRRAGARPVAADPLYDAGELEALGLEPWDGGEVDGIIIQADHAEYASLDPADYPGVKAVLDGRGVTAPESFAEAGVVFLRLGQPAS